MWTLFNLAACTSLVLIFLVGCSTSFRENYRTGGIVRTEKQTGNIVDSRLAIAPGVSTTGPLPSINVTRISRCEQFEVKYREEIADRKTFRKVLTGGTQWEENPILCFIGGLLTFGIDWVTCRREAWRLEKVDLGSTATGRVLKGKKEQILPVRCKQEPWSAKTLTISIFDLGVSLPASKYQPSSFQSAVFVLNGHDRVVTSVVFSPDGNLLASGSWDDTIRLWDVSRGRQVYVLKGHGADVNSVAYSPDGRFLASGSDDKTVRLWDVSTGRVVRVLRGHKGIVYYVTFLPDGRLLASASGDSTVRLWDVSTGRVVRVLRGQGSTVRSLAFSPDGRLLASGSYDTTIRLWEVSTGRVAGILKGHGDVVTSVAFSPDGGLLASASADKSIRIWETETGHQIHVIKGHESYVRSVAFSPHGRIIASGADDFSVRFWELKTGNEVSVQKEHMNFVRAIAFSPSGRFFASGSDDETVRIWELPAHFRKYNKSNPSAGFIEPIPVWKWEGSTGPDSQIEFTPNDYRTFLRVVGAIAGDGRGRAKVLIQSENLKGEMAISKDFLIRLISIDMRRLGKPTLTPFPKAVINLGSEGLVRAGELLPITVTIRNGGKDSIYQLKGKTSSTSAAFHGLEFLFGYIPPGQSRTWTTGVRVPKDFPTKDVRFSIHFSELNGFIPEALQVGLAVEGLPRPRFAFAYRIIDDGSGNSVGNGDGRFQKGEAVDLLVTVKNTGKGPAKSVRASLSHPDLKGVILHSASRTMPTTTASYEAQHPGDERRIRDKSPKESVTIVSEVSLGDIPVGSAKTVRFTVTALRQTTVREVPLKLEIEEKSLPVREQFNLSLPLDVRIPPQILAIRQVLIVKSATGTLRGGAGTDTPEFGRVNQGAQLLAVGELGEWYQVQLAEGERAWVAKNDVTLERKSPSQAPASRLQTAAPKTTVVRVFQIAPPVIVIVTPQTRLVTNRESIELRGKVVDPGGELQEVEIRVNDVTLAKRTVSVVGKTSTRKAKAEVDLHEKLPLKVGLNSIEIRAKGKGGRESNRKISVTREALLGNLYAVVIGIDRYRSIRPLKYAGADARAFANYVTTNLKVPRDNVKLLLNERATARSIRKALGTDLARKSTKQDTVLIYYAGHGVSEPNRNSPDGDGFDKYLVPFDADPQDLYSTAIPMDEFSRIFNRIEAERIILIMDACFSGASGGRTFRRPGIRADTAPLSEAFLTRITQGKGRLIFTASGPAELSVEKDKLGHGVFTYYLLEGLRGAADLDGDTYITIQEISTYVTRKVPLEAPGQRPLLKGTIEGEFILGRSSQPAN